MYCTKTEFNEKKLGIGCHKAEASNQLYGTLSGHW